MCRRLLELLGLVLACSSTSAFLPSPASSSSSTTTARTPCHATVPSSSSSSSSSAPSQQLDRLGALRFLAGAFALPALVVLSPGGSGVRPALAQDSSPAEEALTRVIIVKDSTEQLEDELTNGNSYPDVKALINSLLRNYQLKNSMDTSLALLPSSLPSATKEDAKKHAKNALENLIIILEYFPQDQAGPLENKTLKPEQLEFTIKALKATRKELAEFLGFFDEGLRKKLAEGVAGT